MQTPALIFDHINKAVALVGVDPKAEEKLADLIARERHVVMGATGRPKPTS